MVNNNTPGDMPRLNRPHCHCLTSFESLYLFNISEMYDICASVSLCLVEKAADCNITQVDEIGEDDVKE